MTLGNASLNGRRRVVITGLGAVSPLGLDVESSWASLLAGDSGAAEITQFDHSDYPVHFACEVKDFDATDWIDRKAARRMDRFTHLILAAARQAEADSGLDISKEADRVGASIATGIGGLQSFQDCYDVLKERGPDRVNPFSIPAIIPNLGAGWVSIELGTRGPLLSECTACAASNMAIGDGTDAIRLGRADVMICGGTEAAVTQVGIAGFGAMRALSRRNDDPERASRPFDAERDGFVMGEAGAVLVLEELDHAQARGAKIYAEVVGYGLSSDAKHITDPDPTGPVNAFKMALAGGWCGSGRGRTTSTRTPRRPRSGTRRETQMLKYALGEENAYKTPVSGDEGRDRPLSRRRRRDRGDRSRCSRFATGSCRRRSTTRSRIPPAISTTCPNEARDADVKVAMSNSFGFGGHNACVVFKRFED